MNESNLRAYLATALTGLGETERRELFADSDCVAEVCKHAGILLYQPREHTDPLMNAERPAREVYLTDRERVATSDLIVALCSQPSFGVGAENEIAAAAGVPALYVVKRGSRLSKMLTGSLGQKRVIEYADSNELRRELSTALTELEPGLRERRKKYQSHDGKLLPSRLKDLRERSGMNLQQLAAAAGMTVEHLQSFESADDRVSLMTVEQLRTLSEALSVPGSYLLGEMQPAKDPVAYQSLQSLKNFARSNSLRFPVYEKLWSEYEDSRRRIGFVLKTRDTTALTEEDWGKRYEALLERGRQKELDLMP